MDTVHYQYPPLKGHGTIRILTLGAGRQDDPLRGELETVPIESAGSYEALSYVWAEPGPPNCVPEILIGNGKDNDAALALSGGSIVGALRRLRLPDRPRRIWADQCCINQGDPAERSEQVQFMNRIFRDAARVLVWLGLDTENQAEPAFGLVRKLDEIFHRYQAGEGTTHLPAATELERHIRMNLTALQALTNRAWFRRGWIVQEIGTRTPATLHWGDAASMDWDVLAGVCERLKGYHRLRNALGLATSDVSFLHRRFVAPPSGPTHHANRFNFVYELQRARHLRFGDDRDRVFAFLGHFSLRSRHPLGCGGSEQDLEIAADYTATVEKLYVDVAVRLLLPSGRPGAAVCIVLAAVQHPSGSLPSLQPARTNNSLTLDAWLKDKRTLSSWVPDWRQSTGIILAEPICPHRAQGGSAAEVEILAPGADGARVLRIRGVEVDTVAACSRPLGAEDFYGDKRQPGRRGPAQTATVDRLWRGICGKRRFDLTERYPHGSGQTAFFAFMQTLSNGCVQAAGHRCVPYHEVPDRAWLRKAARYVADALGASGTVSEDVRALAAEELAAHPERDDDSWSRWATSAAEGRVFARTEGGRYVLGPAALEAGDVVCVLFGCKVPFCLRPVGGRYLLVGECYVHGLMNGEAIEMLARNELREKTFDLV